MVMKNASSASISMIGKLSLYRGGNFSSTPVNIEDLISGKTSLREEATCQETYLKSIEFDIFIHSNDGKDNEDMKKVGVLTGRLFDIEGCDKDDFDPMEIFDSVDQYTYEVYSMGQKHHRKSVVNNNIFAIDSFEIHPDYRCKDVGTATIHILSEVIEAQFNMIAGCFIVVPEPSYDTKIEETFDKERCERFWERLGFKQLEGSPYWYFNLAMEMLVNGKNRIVTEDYYPRLVAESTIAYEHRTDFEK